MREARTGTHKLYKGRYCIVFYDRSDRLLYLFDNVREILQFQRKDITRLNVIAVNTEIRKALTTDTHFTRFLTGDVMKVYIIDASDDEEKGEQENG